MSVPLRFLIFVGLAAGIGFFLLRYIEARTLFYPTKEIASSPDGVQLEFQDVFFKTADQVTLHGWYVPAQNAAVTVLFSHGNAGNISHRIEKLKFFHQLGCGVFIFDYRGYGRSGGRPTEKGFYRDAQAAYDWLLSRGIGPSRIIGYGESIGGAVIVDLASRETMKAVILDSTLTSVKDMVARTYPFVPYWVFSSRFDSESKIKAMHIPKLMIHSLNDEIIPYELGRKLYEVSAPPKKFVQVHGGHNSNFYESEQIIRDEIENFLTMLKEGRP